MNTRILLIAIAVAAGMFLSREREDRRSADLAEQSAASVGHVRAAFASGSPPDDLRKFIVIAEGNVRRAEAEQPSGRNSMALTCLRLSIQRYSGAVDSMDGGWDDRGNTLDDSRPTAEMVRYGDEMHDRALASIIR